jgi:thiol-disulfide isomerase/thioredoxin
VVIAFTGALAAQEIPAEVSPDAANALVLKDSNGRDARLSDHRGKVVILNFWATWCIPCREEMPLLVNIQKRYADRGVVVIGAAADDESTRAQIAPFVEKLGITFPIWTGATTEHMKSLGMGTGLPVTAIVDQQGRLAFRLLGILKRGELVKRIEYLLGSSTEPAPAVLVDRITEAQKEAAAHAHKPGEEENHSHGGVGMEGASTVPS